MAGARRALIVANDTYEHDGLRHLQAPAADAEALAGVLGDSEIGEFGVSVVHNEPAHVVQAEIEELFSESRSDDLLLLHFSCHGLKSESGELFFAARNTRPNRLASTATSADFVQRCMRTSRARSIVLLLDCCYGGAFSAGVTVRASGDVNVLDSFPPERPGGGRGRAVITASSAMEYAFEGDHLADDHAPQPSVFTSALVEGLMSGEADRDQDGWVSLNELYDYIFDRVREQNPHQTPSRDVEMQGELYLARRRGAVTVPSPLPPELQEAAAHPLAGIRAGSVTELVQVARGAHAGRALAARQALETLADDDSRAVSAAATAALSQLPSSRTPNEHPIQPPPATEKERPVPPSRRASPAAGPSPPAGPSSDDGPTPTRPASPDPAPASAPAPAATAQPVPAATAQPEAEPAPAATAQPGIAAAARGWMTKWGRWVPGVVAVLVVAALLVPAFVSGLVDGWRDKDAASSGAMSAPTASAGVGTRFTESSPWRLVIEDRMGGGDTGCEVTLTNTGTAEKQTLMRYGTTSWQMRTSGEFGWTANSPKCLVNHRADAGSLKLPAEVRIGSGDTDAFSTTEGVSATVRKLNSGTECELSLYDSENGQLYSTYQVKLGESVGIENSKELPDMAYFGDVQCGLALGTFGP
ncbi:caspase domain-containing protein [Actinoplanes sp. GCM10030250]|uniref:caspase family protein n=1 Tax=Actinoplanes sp. GCM10030250 TaxID=3273376 RepID=UPI00361094BF